MLGLHTNFAQWGQTFSGAMPTYHIITCIFRLRRHKATADFRQGSLAKPHYIVLAWVTILTYLIDEYIN